MNTNVAIEIAAPDLSSWRSGNAGVAYVHVLDSGRAGPNVMLQALTHGNELCGAIALDSLLREGVAPRRGRLTLAFANVAAFERFDLAAPHRSRFIDEDYNRVWADAVLDGPRDSAELRRARELRAFVDAADFLLDIHSMHEKCRPIMVCGTNDKGVAFARRIGTPADLLVDTGHPLGMRMRDRGGFGDPASPKNAALIECGQHWEQRSVDVAIDTALRFLLAVDAVAEDWVRPRLRLAPPPRQRVIRVSEPVVARSSDFRFERPWQGLEVVPKKGSVIAWSDGAPVTTPYDDCVLVMPSLAQLRPGVTTVRLGRYDD